MNGLDLDRRVIMRITHCDADRAATTVVRNAQVSWGVDALIAPLQWRSL